MSSVKRLRKSICDVIASGAKNTSVGIDSQLDKIFASYFVENDESSASDGDGDGNDDNVTPLMVACDTCCSDALIYLRNQIRASRSNGDNLQALPPAIPLEHVIEAWGHPTEASSCGNGAAHHALASGFGEGLDLLQYMWDCIEKESEKDSLQRYLSLLSQTNQNGDTPLMCFCVSGHVDLIKHILELSFKLALTNNRDNMSANVKTIWQSLKDIFSLRNSEECTALNLACGHGHIDIAKFLIQSQRVLICSNSNSLEATLPCRSNENNSQKEDNDTSNTTQVCTLNPLVIVAYTDVDFCNKTIEDLATGLKFMQQHNQVEKIKEFDVQHKQAKECLAALECELEKISAETANELLLDNGTVENKDSATKANASSGGHKSKGRSKKKKKQKRNIARESQAPQSIGSDLKVSDNAGETIISNNETSNKSWANAKDEPKIGDSTHQSTTIESPFITLHDGSIVSKSQKADDASSMQADNSSLDGAPSTKPEESGAKPKALQNILQSTSACLTDIDDIAAIMESLCLDPSMLLLSPHGMAMEMSPCQLDAIVSILDHQLKATKEAQQIQSRLLDK